MFDKVSVDGINRLIDELNKRFDRTVEILKEIEGHLNEMNKRLDILEKNNADTITDRTTDA